MDVCYMDCVTAKDYINMYADNMLSDSETEQLFSHISTCKDCQKELDYILALKKALSGFDELEPPEGLALAALKKARKKRISIFAYASIGVAAAAALIVISSTGFLQSNDNISTKQIAAAPVTVASAEAAAPDLARAPAPAASAVPTANAAPQSSEEAGVLSGSMAIINSSKDITAEASNALLIFYYDVPAEFIDNFMPVLQEFILENGIQAEYYGQNGDIISFVVSDQTLTELKKIIKKANLPHYGDPVAGCLVEFVFE